MSFKAKTRKPGDLIKSEDWNEAMNEIENLGNTKVGIDGGALNGPLKITGQLGVTDGVSEWVVDGSEKDQLKIKSGDQQKLVITDEGGVGIGMENPNDGLAVDGPVVRKVWVATGAGPNDNQNTGLVARRKLSFKKHYHDTAIRIVYHDNFRVAGSGVQLGRWEILVNDAPPPGGRIYQDVHASTSGGISSNFHLPSAITGYATGLKAGQHVVTIRVGNIDGRVEGGDRYTGWNASRWTIEAEEVWIQE